MATYWDFVKRMIDESDVVLEVLDARMPDLSRNDILEDLIKNKGRSLIFVLNKADLVSKNILEKEKKWLQQFGDCVYVSSKDKSTPKKLWAIIFKHLKNVKKESYQRWRIGIAGYPNTGKSSLINLLSKKHKAVVSKKAGTTHGVQWITIGDKIKLLDSPGVIPLRREDPLRYGLLGIKDAHRIRNVEAVSHAILDLFKSKNKKALENFFRINLEDIDDNYTIFEKIAKSKGYLQKGGNIDENRTALKIVRAWQEGDLRL